MGLTSVSDCPFPASSSQQLGGFERGGWSKADVVLPDGTVLRWERAPDKRAGTSWEGSKLLHGWVPYVPCGVAS